MLFLQLHLNPHAIENLQFRADHKDGRRIDGQLHPQIVALQAEGGPRKRP